MKMEIDNRKTEKGKALTFKKRKRRSTIYRQK